MQIIRDEYIDTEQYMYVDSNHSSDLLFIVFFLNIFFKYMI